MKELLGGVADLGRGFRFWGTSPRLMLLGALPAVVVGLVWGGLLLWLVLSVDGVAAAITPFADPWDEPWRSGFRVLTGVAVLLVAGVLAVLTFTAVVLAVGDPFYERISGAIERRLGGPPPERDEPLLRGLVRAARDGLRLGVASLGVGLLVLLVGLIPVVGAVLGFAVGVLLGGPLLAVELTAVPFEARGHPLAHRRAVLAAHRARTLGFGAAVWLVFLIPFAAVVAMPAAVAGATVLARRLLEDEAAVAVPSPTAADREAGDGPRG